MRRVLLGHRTGGTISMTLVAVIDATGVIEYRIGKGAADTMTNTAVFRSRRMRWRGVVLFTRRIGCSHVAAVVTGFTISSYAVVGKVQQIKGRGVMTEVTILRGRHMGRGLHQIRHRGKEATDMATFATRSQVDMHIGEEHRVGKTTGRGIDVALRTLGLRRDVVDLFA